MGQSLVQIYVHIVYSTKHRKPFLVNADHQSRLHAYLAGTFKKLDAPSIIVGGVEDHVHVLCRLGKAIDIATLIQKTRKSSSEWAKTDLSIPDFYWQTGYGAFSVSPGHVEPLKKYIANQAEHHRKTTFQEEFRKLCKKYGLELDERYVWE